MTLSHEQFYVYLHAAEGRLARAAETRWRDAVEAVRTGYVVARNKDAAAKWDRYLAKRSGRRAGLRGESLERAMSSLILTHPEFVKGVRRPRSLQPRALWGAEAAGKRSGKRSGKGKG